MLCDAPAEVSQKDLDKLALGVGSQYAAQGRVRSNESVSALLFATARQVAADQELLTPAPDLSDRRGAFLRELRAILADMDQIHQLSAEEFRIRQAQFQESVG